MAGLRLGRPSLSARRPTRPGRCLPAPPAPAQGSGPRERIEMAPRGRGLRTGETFRGSHPTSHAARPAPAGPPGSSPPPSPRASPILRARFLSSFPLLPTRDRSPPGEAKGGVCAMGRGLGNGSPALGGAAGGFLPDPGAGPNDGPTLLSHTSPHRPGYIPVHCRTGQSFAPKN